MYEYRAEPPRQRMLVHACIGAFSGLQPCLPMMHNTVAVSVPSALISVTAGPPVQDAASLYAFWQEDCTLPVMVMVWSMFSFVLMNSSSDR